MATDPHHIGPTAYLEELLAQASPDLMRQMLSDFINQILSAQADSVCGADYATVSESRTNTRNGYRHRQLDTRVGTIDVAIFEATPRGILPRLAPRTAHPYRARAYHRNSDVLPQRGSPLGG
ncbi:hypothetical protein FRC0129_02093 [Corynebacterium diphtheriae]|nr:hypothetical protein CIP107549_02077 [Corynebacterium diphtheriae]CAB0761213.1 hypothetical protein FRC0129_02093 [Corynebacterium diphtheriae]CAB0828347.1 hypothetical protein FRC0293_01911 [Corynebacterium diphtheriae]CAB0858419.1 hypothetical protein FRC0294_01913 [Corynebacterium diphtheriae]